MEALINHFNYWIYIILMMIGLHAMIAKRNLIKKLVGMSIFQTAIILFYVSIGVKAGATIPILSSDLVPHGSHQEETHHADETADGAHPPAEESPNKEHENHELPSIDAKDYANPIPHVLMLTAIVVGVGTLGLALAIAQRVHQYYGTVEEDEILNQIHRGTDG